MVKKKNYVDMLLLSQKLSQKTFVPMFDRVFHVNIVMLYYNIKYECEDIKMR
jgi:hypothetical protein